MSGYSEDLRTRIVSAVQNGMSNAQAARTFSVSLSSVKRYVNKAERGESLAPKKRPGSAPKLDEKATRLLAADLEERPYLTLRERCEYNRRSDGALCESFDHVPRHSPHRYYQEKGGESPPNVTSSTGRPGG